MNQVGRRTALRKARAKAPSLAQTHHFDETAELMKLAATSTRLKLLFVLDSLKELSVSDLSSLLEVSVSAISQHLAKLRVHGLVKSRRDAQTIYYRLGDNEFLAMLRQEYFRPWARSLRPARSTRRA